jgi:hypothetical protein
LKNAMSIVAALAAALLAGCAVAPPRPALSRPMAPLYHAGAASCAAGSKDVAPVATLTFTPPTANTDGTPVNGPLTYNLYEGAAPGAEVKAATGITASPHVIDSGLKGGTTEYFELTATDALGSESARSNEACKAFPLSPPGAFVISVQ